ncbi:polymeric immunoglobulin receptor-like isoform X3 [Trachinotus anak]|uniref:polymeric immunoglobulin receptor-like isoform X3 n=1 Tax=Trachinotus anak TaxID=443729 RepID=UPI0039F1BC44
MRSFLLLILTLMTGCEASSEVQECLQGWVEFTCKYPETLRYQIKVENPNGATRTINPTDVCQRYSKCFLHNVTKNKILWVTIEELLSDGSGENVCKSKSQIPGEHQRCKRPFSQTAYTTAKTTITCDDLKYDDESRVKFFCKEKGGICEEISSNGRFILTNTNSSFNMSISNVSSEDTGVYWCGLKSRGYRTALRKIQLEVQNITQSTISSTVGRTFTYLCDYNRTAPIKKFICKGEDPSTCQPLVSTAKPNEKFSMKDDKRKGTVTITVRAVTADDAGTYWCGAENNINKRSNPFFHRFIMTVDGSSFTETVIAPVIVTCAAALVLTFVLVYKRYRGSKDTRNEKEQNVNEDYGYAEVQEGPPEAAAPQTVYVKANFPTNQSAFTHCSVVPFQVRSGEVSGDTYSTVRGQCPIYSTVNHPSRFSKYPLYSTVNNPQQH